MKAKKSIRLLTLIMSVILLVSLFGTAGTAFADEDEESDIEKSIPPGQMVRNGLTGPVVCVNVTAGYFLVETKFGVVRVNTDIVKEYTDEQAENMTGQRVAVKLGKIAGGASSYAHNGTDNGTDSEFGYIYRVATALQFRLIPSKGALKHKWGSVESLGQGCIFIDEEGNQIPVQCGNSSGNVIGLVGGSGNGTSGNGTPLLLQTQQMSRIQNRIQQRLQQADCNGDAKTCERLEKQLRKFVEKQQRLEEQKAERAAIRAEKGQKKGNN